MKHLPAMSAALCAEIEQLQKQLAESHIRYDTQCAINADLQAEIERVRSAARELVKDWKAEGESRVDMTDAAFLGCANELEAALASPSDDAVEKQAELFLIHFEDADRPSEVIQGEAAARQRYRDISVSWNAHLFVKIDSNTRDCAYPNRPWPTLASQAAEPVQRWDACFITDEAGNPIHYCKSRAKAERWIDEVKLVSPRAGYGVLDVQITAQRAPVAQSDRDYNGTLEAIARVVGPMVTPDPEVERALHDNLDELYVTAPVAHPIPKQHGYALAAYDLVHCPDCGFVKTDGGKSWGVAANQWFPTRAHAELYKTNGHIEGLPSKEARAVCQPPKPSAEGDL